MRSATLLLFFCVSSAMAQTSYPMITHASPVVVQRGQSAEVVVEGQMNFHGVDSVLFEGSGVRAEVVTTWPARVAAAAPPQAKAVTLKVTVAADAAPGPREFRLVSPLGVSSIGQLIISADPVVPASGKNISLATAQTLTVPCVVSGRIKAAEEFATYRFHGRVGQTFTFEIQGARIEDKIHDLQKHFDPMLIVSDDKGRELSANDDFFFADPQLAFTCRSEGDYLLTVRDSKYDGDPRWVYALFVTDQPAVSHIYPMCANPGQVVEVEPVGSARLVRQKVSLKAPMTPGLHEVSLDVNGKQTRPVAFVVSPLPQVLQQPGIATPEKAQRVAIPCGINGRLEKARQLGHYLFKASAGKAIRFEVMARRFGTPLQSGLDSVLEVLGPKGEVLASNDDTFGKDALVVFTPPTDGEYVLRIRDLNSKGGPTFVYHIEADWARPDFSLRCDGDKAMIGPGSRTAWYVHVTRANGFTGPVEVTVKGLPVGVTVNPLTIPPTMTQGVLVLSAAADAKRAAVNVEVVGRAPVNFEGKQETVSRVATPNEEIYLPGGGRGRIDVIMHTVAITEPSDILDVQISPGEIRLKPGQEVRVDVTVQRRGDYDKGVSLDILLRHLTTAYGNPLPPGVTVVESKSQTLLGNGSKGHLVLKAAPDAAPISGVPVCVLAHVSVNFVVKISYASKPVLLSVEK